jgi:hypothetical protein
VSGRSRVPKPPTRMSALSAPTFCCAAFVMAMALRGECLEKRREQGQGHTRECCEQFRPTNETVLSALCGGECADAGIVWEMTRGWWLAGEPRARWPPCTVRRTPPLLQWPGLRWGSGGTPPRAHRTSLHSADNRTPHRGGGGRPTRR